MSLSRALGPSRAGIGLCIVLGTRPGPPLRLAAVRRAGARGAGTSPPGLTVRAPQPSAQVTAAPVAGGRRGSCVPRVPAAARAAAAEPDASAPPPSVRRGAPRTSAGTAGGGAGRSQEGLDSTARGGRRGGRRGPCWGTIAGSPSDLSPFREPQGPQGQTVGRKRGIKQGGRARGSACDTSYTRCNIRWPS